MNVHTSPIIRKIFLSCVTKEFLPHREMLASDLSLPNVKVQVQEDFVQGGGSLLEKLDDYIKSCDAVVHLVGSATGFEPKQDEITKFLNGYPDFAKKIPCLKEVLEQAPSSLSYTQWEAWLALYHNVDCYVYRADASTSRAANFVENPNERKKQDEHFDRFRSYGKDRAIFESDQHLCRLVLRSLNSILPPGHRKLRIVPKGLLAFDENDSDFFLDLLPGPRDKDDLPESIRFWKYWIETSQPSFSVGVIYGPSGCGKSSLIKAGLVPRLAPHVEPIHVEATADDTESSLLRKLWNHCPELPKDLGLLEAMDLVSHGQQLKTGHKILIVLDQFEQFLHAKRNQAETELVRALRHCNGTCLQCILLVRDDFWMAISRFLDELNVKLLEGHNTAKVDLFDLIHARKVLLEFGQAFGRINNLPSKDQEAFLNQAIKGLAQDDRIVPVRLALFAQMFQGKEWTLSELKNVGGIDGVGFKFLEEAFATPKFRTKQKSAQKVLRALLPEPTSDINASKQSHEKLLNTSGYSKHPELFERLLDDLDGDLKLIKGIESDAQSSSAKEAKRFYQLTHDYLVPSLRAWLTRKQKETFKGRAELLLEDQAVIWTSRPENRYLPSLFQFIRIQLLTKNWTTSQKKLMRRAGRFHLVRGTSLSLLLAIAIFTGFKIRNRWNEQLRNAGNERIAAYASGLVERTLDAETTTIPQIVGQMADYWHWVVPMLREEYGNKQLTAHQRLNASLALLELLRGTENENVDPLVKYLYRRLLNAEPNEVSVLIEILTPHQNTLRGKLWTVVESQETGKESQRLRGASALAEYDPANEKWNNVRKAVADDVVAQPAVYLSYWLDCLRPVRLTLIPQFSNIFRANTRPEIERSLAADILVKYAADQPHVLANLVMDADKKQFIKIFPKLEEMGESGLSCLITEIDQEPFPNELPSSAPERDIRAKRQANAAIALLRMNQRNKVWSLLKHSPDPRVRSYLIHLFAPLRADHESVIRQFHTETDITIRRALALSLGEYDNQRLPESSLNELLPQLREIFQSNPDPGLHSAVEWLLRKWGQEDWIKKAYEAWSTDEAWKPSLAKVEETLAEEKDNASPKWYVNSQGQTMVVIPGPMEFTMGSHEKEEGRQSDENQHKCVIRHSFAVSTSPVTVEQYRRANPGFEEDYNAEWIRYDDLPAVGINWPQAIRYCNWLSMREGLPTAYNDDERSDSVDLHSRGYRLLTEAELEYCFRAGSFTSRYYGESSELLEEYAWVHTNADQQMQRVKQLKPNDFGLFDVIGNIWTWTTDDYVREYSCDADKHTRIQLHSGRKALRGGSFLYGVRFARSASRMNTSYNYRPNNIGFRCGRTLSVPPTIK